MMESEKTYGVQELANLLKTTPKRIRNYSEHLEELGYTFRKKNTYRVYTEKDLDIIARTIHLKETYKMSISLACETVLAGTDKQVDENGESLLAQPVSNRELILELKNIIGEIATKQDIEDMSRKIEAIIQQRIEEAINESEQRQLRFEEKQNKMLVDALNEKEQVIEIKDSMIEKLDKGLLESQNQVNQLIQALNKSEAEKEFYHSQTQQYLTNMNELKNTTVQLIKQNQSDESNEQEKSKKSWRDRFKFWGL